MPGTIIKKGHGLIMGQQNALIDSMNLSSLSASDGSISSGEEIPMNSDIAVNESYSWAFILRHMIRRNASIDFHLHINLCVNFVKIIDRLIIYRCFTEKQLKIFLFFMSFILIL